MCFVCFKWWWVVLVDKVFGDMVFLLCDLIGVWNGSDVVISCCCCCGDCIIWWLLVEVVELKDEVEFLVIWLLSEMWGLLVFFFDDVFFWMLVFWCGVWGCKFWCSIGDVVDLGVWDIIILLLWVFMVSLCGWLFSEK